MDDNLNLILTNISKAEQFSKGWHENIEVYRRFYNGEHYVTKSHLNEPRFVDPTPTNVVDLAVGIMLSNEIEWKAITYRPEPDKPVSDVEKLIKSLIVQIEDTQEINFLYEIVLHFIRDGGAVLYTTFEPEPYQSFYINSEMLYPDGEVRPAVIFDKIPLRVSLIDPLNVNVLAGSENRWSVVARTERISLYQLVSMFGEDKVPVRFSQFTRSLEQALEITGKLVDYWDFLPSKNIFRHGVLFDGEVVVTLEEVDQKFFPYTIGFYKPTDRTLSSGWHSILEPLLEPVRLLEQSINRRQFLIDKYASLPLVTKTLGGRAVKIDPRIGTHVPLGVDEEIGFPAWSGSPPDVERQIELYRSRIQQSGFSDAFFGSGASSSGYALSLLGDQNRIRLEQPKRHLESFLRRWANRCLDLLTENIQVSGGEAFFELFGTSKSNSYSFYLPLSSLRGKRLVCSITPEFPNDKVRNHAMANQARGILSEQTLMETYYNIPHPSDERERKLQEMAETHPIVMQYGLLRSLQQLAESGDEVAMIALSKVLEETNAQQASGGAQDGSVAQLGGMLNREMPAQSPNSGESSAEVQARMGKASPRLNGSVGGIS